MKTTRPRYYVLEAPSGPPNPPGFCHYVLDSKAEDQIIGGYGNRAAADRLVAELNEMDAMP